MSESIELIRINVLAMNDRDMALNTIYITYVL